MKIEFVRTCEHCGERFTTTNERARFCRSAHRAARWREGHVYPGPVRTPEGAGESLRRPSRNGRGIRIYVSPADSDEKILAKVAAKRTAIGSARAANYREQARLFG